MSSYRASWAEVRAVFLDHVTHYAKTGGGENALVGLRAEGAVTLQYAGRVVYELFQNALDRAASRVVVRFDDGVLMVGNDGRAFGVDPSFDYAQPRRGKERADFNALCALHTSNKSPERQFGNKGIGFRSVFGVSDRARLWSRCSDGGWWGIELSVGTTPAEWTSSPVPELDSIVRDVGDEARPSFHFPRPLRSDEAPHPSAHHLETVVVVEVVDTEHRTQIAHEVERLAVTRFQFIGLRREGLDIAVGETLTTSQSGWPVVVHERDRTLAELAEKASHGVKAPTYAVSWASPGDSGGGHFYNYLPTRMTTGLPVDVHADFQVKADREGMSLDGDNAVGRYNLGLLERAAERHVEALREEVTRAACRDDFWRLAGRPHGAPAAWDKALKDVLFPERSLAMWTELAERFFRASRPAEAYQDFWNASRDWLEVVAGYGHWTGSWGKWARRLCDALSERETAVIPVAVESGITAVPLPSRQERGRSARRRVFYKAGEDSEIDLEIPAPLLTQGRSVTSFELGPFEEPAGVARFHPNEVLRDLRQLPNDPTKVDTRDPLSQEGQGALLRFARRLRPPTELRHFAWRAFIELEDLQRVGRAISTLFLPTTAGQWEPARQLTRDRVDRAKLEAVAQIPADDDDFLDWLGVAPDDAVPLVERGTGGIVPALAAPPGLQAAGTDEVGLLQPILDPSPSVDQLRRSLQGLPPDSERSRVLATVASTRWLPCSTFRPVPPGLEPLPDRIAPEDVVLSVRDPRSVFFAVPADIEHIEPLRELGALDRLESQAALERAPALVQALVQRCPEPGALSASLVGRLAALLDALMQGMPLEGDRVPVLVEEAGSYRWRLGDEPAWLARREERQELRRFYPDLPLVAGTHRKGLAQRLEVGEVRLKKQVRGTGRPTVTELAQQVRGRIDPAVSVLCAVADQSRLARVDADRVRRAWLRQEAVLQVDDAWVQLSVAGPDRPEKPWRKGKFDDVFHLPDPDDAEPGVILFDSHPNRGAGPPLRHFGEPLAHLLVRNAALAPLFAEVLAAVEEGALDDFVERRHVGELAAEWGRELSPLSEDQRVALEKQVDVVCYDAHDVLRRGRVRPADVRTDLGLELGQQVHELLHMDIDGTLVDHLPRVLVAREHERDWERWSEARLRTFEAWLAHRAGTDWD